MRNSDLLFLLAARLLCQHTSRYFWSLTSLLCPKLPCCRAPAFHKQFIFSGLFSCCSMRFCHTSVPILYNKSLLTVYCGWASPVADQCRTISALCWKRLFGLAENSSQSQNQCHTHTHSAKIFQLCVSSILKTHCPLCMEVCQPSAASRHCICMSDRIVLSRFPPIVLTTAACTAPPYLN